MAGARRPSTTGSRDHVHGCPASNADTATSAPPLSGARTIPPHPLPICRSICGYDDDNRGDSCSKRGKKKAWGKKWGASVFLGVFTHGCSIGKVKRRAQKENHGANTPALVLFGGGFLKPRGAAWRGPAPGGDLQVRCEMMLG